MSVKYEDLQYLESEKKSHGSTDGLPPPRTFLHRVLSVPWPLLLSLSLSLLLLVGICVIGSQSGSLQEKISSLKAEVENHKQELQAARSLNDKMFSLDGKLENQQQELKAGYSEMLLQVQHLVKNLKSLTCKVAALESNGSRNTCCPTNWLEHEGSCYWFSSSGKPWPEAEKQCQLEDAHLVVINSGEEQNFVQAHIASYTWMGLSDLDGVWKWADGTDYETNFKNWKPGQPDDWSGHGLGGGEDCAHFHPDGKWNDDACQRPYRWICEAGLSKAT
ncbi:asialoglycoprotein receptor 1 isoform X2 [Camelus bactrianus]|uniref:Asialoglycoprotein receptor 1 isoform X2 n=2 Tax=Camelus bactrianus TaxID=9837 RepID=A0A9W3GKT7_CAMBA|nr:asialoglycoprotein receptor 1 isoform X2 [Camelus bactrianus]